MAIKFRHRDQSLGGGMNEDDPKEEEQDEDLRHHPVRRHEDNTDDKAVMKERERRRNEGMGTDLGGHGPSLSRKIITRETRDNIAKGELGRKGGRIIQDENAASWSARRNHLALLAGGKPIPSLLLSREDKKENDFFPLHNDDDEETFGRIG